MEKKRGLIFLFIVFFFLTFISLSTLQGLNEFSDEQLVEDYLSIGNLAYHEDPSKIIKKNLIFETGPEFVPGEIIVKFKDTEIIRERTLSEIPKIAELNKKHEAGMQKVFRSPKALKTPLANVYKIKLQDNADIQEAISDYLKSGFVEYAEPNYIYRTTAVPNDIGYSKQWAHQNMQSELGWDIEKGSEDVVIAIIDTGVDYTHKDLTANIWNNTDEIPNNGIDDDGNGYVDDIRGWDFVDTNESCYTEEDCEVRDNDPMDFHGHGTHCSGIAAAVANNSIGIAGVCWNCKIMLVRAGYVGSDGLGYFESDDSAATIVYSADNDVSIISMSWGGYRSSSLIKEALDYAYSKGAVLVGGAGNDNTNQPFYPAAYDNVIAVAATDEKDTKAEFSNHGDWIDVAAPGVSILSTYSCLAAGDCSKTWYAYMSGTSMSTPFVAGLAGLILSKNPGLTQDDVKQILRSSTDPIISIGYIGTGRINVYKALQIDLVPLANIIYPLDNDALQGMIEIKGTASGLSFQNYIVEYGKGIYPKNWIMLTNSTTPVVNDVLAVLNTDEITDGTYKIKLKVNSADGWAEDESIVIVVNDDTKCYSCRDCNYKINKLSSNPILSDDIDTCGICIEIKKNYAVFDCNNHIIGYHEEYLSPYDIGILSMSNFTTIKNCKLSNNDFGILLLNSNNNIITNNNASDNYGGIYLEYSGNNTITNNNASDNYYDGISMYYSGNNNITNNNVLNNEYGIYLEYSGNNAISNNNALNNFGYGIYVGYSNNNTITNNNALNNHKDIYGFGIYLEYSGNNIITNNNVSNNNFYGISMHHSSNNRITNNNASNHHYGLFLYHSSNNIIIDNNALNNDNGIYLKDYSSNNIITDNNASNIRLYSSSNNTITDNNAGIHLEYSSSNNIITDNNALNKYAGIWLYSLNNNNNIITNNNVLNNEYGIYLESSSSNNIITNNNASNNRKGILLGSSSNNNTITNNNVLNNYDKGISIYNSRNNIITNNIVNSNMVEGVFLYASNNNNIYHNNFINNTLQVYDNRNDNSWDNGKEGNYWSDYDSEEESCSDANENGICDSPYVIDSDSQDNYPFINEDGWIIIECPGNVNGDGKVDIFDLAKVGLCYGCSSAQACWTNCKQADVREDNKIDIFDLATVGLNYGKSC